MRCCGSEKKAISDEEKKPERPINTIIENTPRMVIVLVSRAGNCNAESSKEATESDNPIGTDACSALKLSVVLAT